MSDCSIYLIESGFPDNLPGFIPEVPGASFPFWGQYCLLDVAAAAFADLSNQPYKIIAEPRYRALAPFLTARSQGQRERPILADRGIEGFMEILESDPSSTILLCPLNLACFPDRKAMRKAVENTNTSIVRICIQNVETPVYTAARRALLRALDSYR